MTDEKKMTCDRHGEYISRCISFFGHTLTWTGCPECSAEKEAQDAKEAQIQADREFKASWPKRGIEPEFLNATLDNYKAETPSEKQALQAAREVESGEITKLLLLGANGTGKTHLGVGLVKSQRGIRTTMFELSARIRAGYNNGESELATLNKLLQYPLIVIDEVGRTKGSEAERNWWSYLVDKAHTRHIRLVLISNRTTAKNLPPERRGEAFEYYFDNDVISRLRQDSKIVEVRGRDRRAAVAKIPDAEAASSTL